MLSRVMSAGSSLRSSLAGETATAGATTRVDSSSPRTESPNEEDEVDTADDLATKQETGSPPSSSTGAPPTSVQPLANANSDTTESSGPPALQVDSKEHPRALKVLFLSSDTGGGHRASATSLAQQFVKLFPGSAYTLCDIIELDGPPPYNMLVRSYKHLSCHPQQWKLVYQVSNTRAYEMLADVHMKSAMEKAVRRRILSYDPDVVVSVHPLMTNVPVLACSNINRDTGKHLPIFTVCTDLGSAHSFWFANGVERLFVASDAIRDLAMNRGKVPLEKIVMSGLPIRHDFSVQSTNMGGRHTDEGRAYQRSVRCDLGLGMYKDTKTVLVMGGGEGCGRLSNIVDALYLQFVERNMDALILVVCGRNEMLKSSLEKRDWDEMRNKYVVARTAGVDFDSCVGVLSEVGCVDGGGVANHLRRIISTPTLGIGGLTAGVPPGVAEVGAPLSLPGSRSSSPTAPGDGVEVMTKSTAERNNLYDLDSLVATVGSEEDGVIDRCPKRDDRAPDATAVSSESEEIDVICEEGVAQDDNILDSPPPPNVKVVGLGFITRMAEYMVAADVLVSKAGPGTIAEAAALSLPVMLTSFLPGQEEGNVDYVVQGNFGTFVSDSDPQGISEEVASWLNDEHRLRELSDNARGRGAPDAAVEIVEAIGESALRWKKVDEESTSSQSD